MEAEELKLPEVRQEIRAASELMVELQTQLDSVRSTRSAYGYAKEVDVANSTVLGRR